jgi:hypothetical protein
MWGNPVRDPNVAGNRGSVVTLFELTLFALAAAVLGAAAAVIF